MDKIFISLFEYGKNRAANTWIWGWRRYQMLVNHALALSVNELRFIFEYGDRFYAFQGLRSYKNKYVTKWSAKYTAYRKTDFASRCDDLGDDDCQPKHLKKGQQT